MQQKYEGRGTATDHIAASEVIEAPARQLSDSRDRSNGVSHVPNTANTSESSSASNALSRGLQTTKLTLALGGHIPYIDVEAQTADNSWTTVSHSHPSLTDEAEVQRA